MNNGINTAASVNTMAGGWNISGKIGTREYTEAPVKTGSEQDRISINGSSGTVSDSGSELKSLAAKRRRTAEATQAPQTQAEMNEIAACDYKAANAEMSTVYQQLKTRIGEDNREILADAQKAWIEFRDKNSECWAAHSQGGSIYPLLLTSQMTAMTEARTAEMKKMMEELECM